MAGEMSHPWERRRARGNAQGNTPRHPRAAATFRGMTARPSCCTLSSPPSVTPVARSPRPGPGRTSWPSRVLLSGATRSRRLARRGRARITAGPRWPRGGAGTHRPRLRAHRADPGRPSRASSVPLTSAARVWLAVGRDVLVREHGHDSSPQSTFRVLDPRRAIRTAPTDNVLSASRARSARFAPPGGASAPTP